MDVMQVWEIGYGYWIWDKLFSQENSYNAYVVSLSNDYGIESEIVGYIMLELNKRESYSFIQGLFVEERYRHRGIAKRLINEAEIYSRSIGCKNIKAEIKNYLFGFYNDLGFSICKKKNDSTYFISKSLERIKEISEDRDLER